jgi:hypothetical protein
MELGHLNQSLYPRAVTPSVEGRLRQDGQERELSSDYTSPVNNRASNAIQQGRAQRVQRDETERRRFDQESIQRQNAQQEQEISGYSNAASFGDRMAVASQQARQSHARRGYSAPALVSARGREANRRYLETSLSNQPRFVDELV